ncbi:MAG: L,D-transpeptidase family protein [Oscillospiraceae bacterium]|nr:L,D-transpeptidase family protein [Oscillospiraceae bacterium]
MKNSKITVLSIILAIVIAISVITSITFSVYAHSDAEEKTTVTAISNDNEETDFSSTTEEISVEETSSATEETTVTETSSTPVIPDTTTTTPPAKPVVPTVNNIKKTSNDLTKISIKWSKVKDAYSYILYMRNKDAGNRFKQIKETKNNTYTFTGLRGTTRYDLGVKAVIKYQGEKISGEMKILNTFTKTLGVTGLKLKSAKKNITIKWNKRDRVTGYKVYRASAASKSKYVQYKVIKGANKTSFTDKNVKAGKLYFYRVKAYRNYVGIGTSESALSEKNVVSTVGLAAVKTTASSQLSKVNLSWSKNSAANCYKVYYASKKKGNYKKLCTTTATSYTTPILKKDKTYYFKVVPCKTISGKTLTSASANIVSKKVSDKIFGKSVGTSYIEISIDEQYMWMYKNGKLICGTPVVTGNDDGVHNTPKGIHSMMCHQSPATLSGPTWNVKVTFWMQFTSDGCGIHDSTWRADWEYGGTTYKGNGSHGCVNTPYSSVKKIYDNSYVGYKVIVR